MAGLNYPVSQLDNARVVLHQRWEQTRGVWNDRVQREFERDFILPLEQQQLRTRESMERLSQVLAKVHQVVR